MGDNADHVTVSTFLSSERLASLSDTRFGVAMTLVATTLLPSVEANKGSVPDMLRAMSGELISVVLSFAISARYWVSQQQRLAMTPSVTPRQTWLHLVFLFLIVLAPISTSLPGLAGSRAVQGPVMIYGAHLTLIGLVNLLLWIEVHRSVVAHQQIVRSSLALGIFVLALAVGAIRPDLAIISGLRSSLRSRSPVRSPGVCTVDILSAPRPEQVANKNKRKQLSAPALQPPPWSRRPTKRRARAFSNSSPPPSATRRSSASGLVFSALAKRATIFTLGLRDATLDARDMGRVDLRHVGERAARFPRGPEPTVRFAVG